MDYRSVVVNIYERLAQGDPQPIFDALAPDAQWHEAENHPYWPGKAMVGPEGVRSGVIDQFGGDFPEFHVDPARTVASGTTVLVQGRYIGTTNAGKQLDAPFAHVWDFEGDKLTHFQQYTDTWQWRRVLDSEA